MKTNFQMMNELKNWFPKDRGVISREEMNLVEKTLEIRNRSEVELRNLRDFTVILCNLWMDKTVKDEDWNEHIKHCDRMSAIVSVIDNRLWSMGAEV